MSLYHCSGILRSFFQSDDGFKALPDEGGTVLRLLPKLVMVWAFCEKRLRLIAGVNQL